MEYPKYPVSAIVLADGKNIEWAQGHHDESCYTALVKVGDKCMYEYVIDALMPLVDEIIVIGGWTVCLTMPHFLTLYNCFKLKGGGSLTENLKSGLDIAKNDEILVVTCDLPALTSESIEKFIKDCRLIPGLDFGYSISPVQECYNSFPGINRTAARLKEGKFTGGNVFYLNKDKFLSQMGVIEDFCQNRKQVFKLASLFGVDILFRLILAQVFPPALSISDLTTRISQIFGLNVAGVPADPCICTDVDNLQHLIAYLAYLETIEVRS